MQDSDDEEAEILSLQELHSDTNHHEESAVVIGDTQDGNQDGAVLLVACSGEEADEESDSPMTVSSGTERDSRARSAAQALQRTTRTRRYRSSRRKMKWYKQPEIRRNWRVVAGAFTLVGLGIACVIIGITVEALRVLHDRDIIDGVILFALAVVFLIPGLYFSVVICLAAHRVRNYRFEKIPFFKRL